MKRAAAIAVVSWNTKGLLETCLRSLLPDHESGIAEVWVVDNASTDGSAEMVRNRFPWVNLIASGENLGFGRAVNLVAARTRLEWIAPANADIEMQPGALSRLIERGRRGSRVASVAPRLVLPDGSTQHSVHPFPTIASAFAASLAANWLGSRVSDRLCLPGYWNPERPREVDWAHGAFLLLRRSAFDEVGGFDDCQWMYAEDLDIAWRLRTAGWRTYFEPEARVNHAVSVATSKAWGEDRNRRSALATYDWIRRRRGRATVLGIASANVAGTALRAAVAGARATATGDSGHASERDRLLWHMRLHRLGLRAAPTHDRP